MREAMIHSLKGKVAWTIYSLGHSTSMSAMLDKLDTVMGP